MQTFLPHSNFSKSAEVLDMKRLGKQRVETLQIMKALLTGKGWIHHPATKMWKGYELALLEYQKAVIGEWKKRGYKDTCLEKTESLVREYCTSKEVVVPPFVGDERLHSSHRSSLLRKKPDFYVKFEWSDNPDSPYYWPTN